MKALSKRTRIIIIMTAAVLIALGAVLARVVFFPDTADIALDPDSNWDGREMTMNDLRRLAAKGDNLMMGDFAKFKYFNITYFPGKELTSYIYGFSLEGDFRLSIDARSNIGKPDTVRMESIWGGGGSGIDIRFNDIDAFMKINENAKDPTKRTWSGEDFEHVVYLNGARAFAREIYLHNIFYYIDVAEINVSVPDGYGEIGENAKIVLYGSDILYKQFSKGHDFQKLRGRMSHIAEISISPENEGGTFTDLTPDRLYQIAVYGLTEPENEYMLNTIIITG